jgi:hypothetical protein
MLDGGAQVEIVNASGVKIHTAAVAGAESGLSFDFSEQPAGMYLVRITNGDRVYTAKVMLQ